MPRLCSRCSLISFPSLVWQAGDTEWKKDLSLGEVQHVKERSDSCDLCREINHRLEQITEDNGQNSDFRATSTAEIKLTTRLFASLQRTRERRKAQKHNIKAELVICYVVVEIYPDQSIPQEKWELMMFQPCIDPIPTVDHFCTDLQSSLYDAMVERFSGRLRENMADLRLALIWLSLCERYHGSRCKPKSSISPIGMRLIDVDHMTVVQAPQDARYVALSYTWGYGTHFRCTMANSELLQETGALKRLKLPQTIADAILVTRAAQLRYLWVDALCVTQDDNVMIHEQIPQMSFIYAQAAFTIVAASGDNADSGLSGVVIGSRKVISTVIQLGDVNLIPLPENDDRPRVHQSAWRSRAWTMQEELFSRRKLYFTKQRLVWGCGSAYWPENEVREYRTDDESGTRIGDQTDHYEHRFSASTSSFAASPDDYRRLVENYSLRQLSAYADTLNAFAGIIKELFEVHQQQVIWGHPAMWFAASLQWELPFEEQQHHSLQRLISSEGAVIDIPFPSWSWSAWSRTQPSNKISWPNASKSSSTWDDDSDICFYRCSNNGLISLIDEQSSRVKSGVFTTEVAHIREKPPWMGEPSIIEAPTSSGNRLWDVDSGLLRFWTSTATVCLRRAARQSRERPWKYTIVDYRAKIISRRVNMQSVNHFPWPNSTSIQSNTMERVDLDSGAIVIGRAQPRDPNPRTDKVLSIMLVEWKEGIAYRRGLASIAERQWIALQREWKLVTLG